MTFAEIMVEQGFATMVGDGRIALTDKGVELYERHLYEPYEWENEEEEKDSVKHSTDIIGEIGAEMGQAYRDIWKLEGGE